MMDLASHNRVFDQSQIFVSDNRVPLTRTIVFSAVVHLAILAWVIMLAYLPKPRIVEEKSAVHSLAGPELAFTPPSARTAPPAALPSRVPRNKGQARAPQPAPGAEGDSAEGVRERARQATAALMTGIKQQHIYGFSSYHFDLPVQTAGEMPVISADSLPPRFEQLVIVEVTIDVDGRVADARIVAGMVDSTIQGKLLSAIREFKYTPAKREGTPIPSQLDLVIHIPT